MPVSRNEVKGRSREKTKDKGSKRVTAGALIAVGVVVILVLSALVTLMYNGRSNVVITMNKTIDNNPSLSYQYCIFVVESVSNDRIPLTDVYLEVKKADGTVGLPRTQLDAIESFNWIGGSIESSTSFTQYGVAFMNNQNESSDYLDPGDGFILNFTTYTYESVISITDQSSRVCCSYTI